MVANNGARVFGFPESRGCARLPRPFRLLPWRLPVVIAAVVVVTVTTVAARTRTGARASQRAHDVERRAVSQPIHSHGQHRRHLALPAERESRRPVSSVVSLSSLLYFPFSLSLSSVLLLRPVVTAPPLVAVVFRSAVTVLRQSSNLFSLSLPPYAFTRPYGHFVLRQLTAYQIRILLLPSIAAESRSSLAFRRASGAVCAK